MVLPIRVMVVDDEGPLRRTTVKYLSQQPMIEVVGQAGGVDPAFALLQELRPDVLLLDIVMDGQDGFDLLQKMQEADITGIQVVLLSGMNSPYYKHLASRYQAAAYLLKTPDHSLAKVYQTILDVARTFDEPEGAEGVPALNVEVRASALMLGIGVPPNVKGFVFLVRAVELSLEEPALLLQLTRRLYPRVAGDFDTQAHNVERDMRNAVRLAWQRTSQGRLDRALGEGLCSVNKRPNNGELIALAVNRLQHGE